MGDKTSQRKLPAARRSPAEKYRLVVESAGLDDEKLGAFLRREGLHEADLERLREEVSAAAIEGLSPKRRGKSPEAKELAAVKKELERKEKALAETAALLVLRGKLEAFLLGDEEGDTTKK